MTEKQAVKEMLAADLILKENKSNLPWQHCMIFYKKRLNYLFLELNESCN